MIEGYDETLDVGSKDVVRFDVIVGKTVVGGVELKVDGLFEVVIIMVESIVGYAVGLSEGIPDA